MRRIRTPAPGETVILDDQPRRRRLRSRAVAFMSIRLEVQKQFAVDFDVRKLLDQIRDELGDALRGDANATLAREYSLGAIAGDAARARATILNTARTGAAYFDRVFPRIAPAVLERVTKRWLLRAMPPIGGGVDTPAVPDTGGGAVPR